MPITPINICSELCLFMPRLVSVHLIKTTVHNQPPADLAWLSTIVEQQRAQLTWDIKRLKVSPQLPVLLSYSGLQLGRARPPLQLAAPGSSGCRLPGAGSTLCQRWRPDTQERVNKQPVTSAEESDPPAQSGAQRFSKPALQTQVEEIRANPYNQWQWTRNDELKLPKIILYWSIFLL